jgi:hypothetical protein
MDHKNLMVRAELFVGMVIVGVSITVTIWMHRTDISYSCLKAPCPALNIGYPAVDRFLIAAAGILAGALIIAFGIFIRRRRHHEG